MCNPDLITLDLKSAPQRIRVTVPNYPDMLPFMGAAMKIFAASMRDKGLERIPYGFADLVKGYYKVMRIEKKVIVTNTVDSFESWDGDKVMVCLTGGKDSAMMLLECVAKYGNENVIGFYVDGINRSEQSYEREAAKRICEKHGVQYIQAQAQISGAMNRSGHLIGLRDQLILSMASMFARQEGVSKLALGLHYDPNSETSPTWSESKTALTMWVELAHDCGFPVELIVLPYNEIETIDKIYADHPDTLALTVSCYTQRNFRENQHTKMRKRYPNSWVHPTGCGLCVKCLRIQGVVAVEERNTEMMDYVVQRHLADYPNDPTLVLVNERIQRLS